MKNLLFCLLPLLSIRLIAQKIYQLNPEFNRPVIDAKYLEKPPVFTYGVDSCKHFYFTHFKGFDSILAKVVTNGDTAKYIRIYFSFYIDKTGIPYNALFLKIATTRYPNNLSARTLVYFNANQKYYDHLVKQMIFKMGWWKPGLLHGLPIECKIEDYIQFWVGLNSPK